MAFTVLFQLTNIPYKSLQDGSSSVAMWFRKKAGREIATQINGSISIYKKEDFFTDIRFDSKISLRMKGKHAEILRSIFTKE